MIIILSTGIWKSGILPIDTNPLIIGSIIFICLFAPSIMIIVHHLQRTLPKMERLKINSYEFGSLFLLSIVIVISMYNPTSTFALYGLTHIQFNIIRWIVMTALFVGMFLILHYGKFVNNIDIK